MKIYYNCQCCNKRNTIAELLMESSWHQGDYQALDTFLSLLQTNIKNKEPLYLSLDEFEDEAKTIPQSLQDKYVPQKDQKKKPTGTKTETPNLEQWKNISPNFTAELAQEWLTNNFTYQQTQEWANVFGQTFNMEDANFCAWLRDEKQLTPEQFLNTGNIDDLREEYEDTFDKEKYD